MKDREYVEKRQRGKGTLVTGEKIQINSAFLSETMQARREWRQLFKVLKEKIYSSTFRNPKLVLENINLQNW